MLACLTWPVINILRIRHVPTHLCFHLFPCVWFCCPQSNQACVFCSPGSGPKGSSWPRSQCPWTCSHTRGCITTRPHPASPLEGKTPFAMCITLSVTFLSFFSNFDSNYSLEHTCFLFQFFDMRNTAISLHTVFYLLLPR